MTETHLGQTIGLVGSKAAYDNACKQLLAHRQILAQILCGALGEFAGVEASDVEKLVRGDPRVQTASVHDSEIVGGPSEDARVDDGKIMYDILFDADLPDSTGNATIMVNVEVQQSRKSWRWLLRRSMYYCSRMLSSQRGRVFKGNGYEKMHKVVSVWICPHAVSHVGTVTSFSMSCRPLAGLWVLAKRNYDLVETIVIRLGNPDESVGVARMLAVLFSQKMQSAEKKSILANEYNMTMTEELEDEVEKMSGMGEALWQEALQEGIGQGIEQGVQLERTAVAQRMRALNIDETVVQAVVSGDVQADDAQTSSGRSDSQE